MSSIDLAEPVALWTPDQGGAEPGSYVRGKAVEALSGTFLGGVHGDLKFGPGTRITVRLAEPATGTFLVFDGSQSPPKKDQTIPAGAIVQVNVPDETALFRALSSLGTVEPGDEIVLAYQGRSNNEEFRHPHRWRAMRGGADRPAGLGGAVSFGNGPTRAQPQQPAADQFAPDMSGANAAAAAVFGRAADPDYVPPDRQALPVEDDEDALPF